MTPEVLKSEDIGISWCMRLLEGVLLEVKPLTGFGFLLQNLWNIVAFRHILWSFALVALDMARASQRKERGLGLRPFGPAVCPP